MYDDRVNFEQGWFLFIALIVVVVVGSPTTDLRFVGIRGLSLERLYAISQMLTETTIDSVRNKTLRSIHFGVVELINCKCGGIVRNEIW